MRFLALLAAFLALISLTLCEQYTTTAASFGNHHPTAPPHPTTPHHKPSATVNYETPEFSFAELYNLTTRFFDAYIYPANTQQVKAINSTLFAENILGRVDVTRNFNGRELNTEYIFGLFAGLQQTPHFFSLVGIPTSYSFIHFAANQNIVSVAVVLNFVNQALGVNAPTEIDMWMTFNADGEISQYDVTFRRFDWQFDWLLSIGQADLGINSTAAMAAEVTALLATSVCETASLYCNGTNLQYTDFDSCYAYLTEDVRLGSSYQLGMNTLLCRMVHQVMVPFRPDVHCSHIGPTGGAYCVDDMTYAGTVTESIFTNTPFVPYGYANKNETIKEM